MKNIQLKKQKKTVDRQLFFLTIALVSLGLIAVADASAPQAINIFNDRFYFVKQQIIAAVVGFVALVIASRIPYKFWERIALPFFIFTLILLIAVLIPGIGTKSLGARRWIILYPVPSFQPSELIKLSLAFYMAKLATTNKGFLAYIIPLVIVGVLIMMQPDLGTLIIITSIGMAQIFVAGVSIMHFIGALVAGGAISILLIMTSDYRRDRFMTFIQQSQDPLGKSYHIRQILLALGLGGMFGVGLGESRQKYLFLPEAATDSIFAIIAEEVGFIGSTAIIIVLLFFIARAFKISRNAPDTFSKVLATGITVWIGSQILLNIGSILALVPLTGVPLPFFSYGGTSLVTIMFAIGILLGISKYENENKSKRKAAKVKLK